MRSELDTNDLSKLLRAWSAGDQSALNGLTPIVYGELRRLAHRYMERERPGHTLQTSALVNEAYIRLIDWKNVRWQNRAHFFAISAQLMRRILVDFARERQHLKRGGGTMQVSLGEAAALTECREADLVALDEALVALAEVLMISKETVMRDWRLAKVWLLRELGREMNGEG